MEWIKDKQPTAGAVAALLAESEAGTARLLMSAINAGEVYYFLLKHHGENLAQSWRKSLHTLPVTVEMPTADDIWDAAWLKGKFRIAYADAFAAALALKHRCPVVTGDPELRSIPGLELDWLGRAAP
jgi:ribonuclease VapC